MLVGQPDHIVEAAGQVLGQLQRVLQPFSFQHHAEPLIAKFPHKLDQLGSVRSTLHQLTLYHLGDHDWPGSFERLFETAQNPDLESFDVDLDQRGVLLVEEAVANLHRHIDGKFVWVGQHAESGFAGIPGRYMQCHDPFAIAEADAYDLDVGDHVSLEISL